MTLNVVTSPTDPTRVHNARGNAAYGRVQVAGKQENFVSDAMEKNDVASRLTGRVG